MHPKYTPQDIERFMSKVQESGDCWLWTARTKPKGYGMFDVSHEGRERTLLAHRFAYEVSNGEIPEGLMVLHTCDTPSCVNPQHLFLGTHRDNMDDMISKGRSTRGERNPTKLYPDRVTRGVQHPKTHLTENDVCDIRWQRALGHTLREIGERYGMTTGAIHSIVARKTWRHVD